jgi:hypothetical protein
MGLLSINREMKGLEEIIRIPEKTRKKVMKILGRTLV